MTVSKKPPSQRQLRVGEELRHILAEILDRGEVRDPDVSGRTITITEVSVSPDLRQATAYVMPLGGEGIEAVLAGLRRARPFLRHEIGRRIRLRTVPNLAFSVDHSFDQAQRIEAILHSPEVARDLETPREDDSDSEPDGA